jgi:hypothetical protein
MIGGIMGLVLTFRARAPWFVRAFYAMFALGLLFTAGEEIAWGQQLFGFGTPQSWTRLNVQGETTLHNIKGLQGRSELFRLAFAYGGFIGLYMARAAPRRFRRIAPPAELFTWFLIVAMYETVNLFNDVVRIQPSFDHYINQMSEVMELLIAGCGVLYVWQKWAQEGIIIRRPSAPG